MRVKVLTFAGWTLCLVCVACRNTVSPTGRNMLTPVPPLGELSLYLRSSKIDERELPLKIKGALDATSEGTWLEGKKNNPSPGWSGDLDRCLILLGRQSGPRGSSDARRSWDTVLPWLARLDPSTGSPSADQLASRQVDLSSLTFVAYSEVTRLLPKGNAPIATSSSLQRANAEMAGAFADGKYYQVGRIYASIVYPAQRHLPGLIKVR